MTNQILTTTNKVIGSSTFRRLWLLGWLAVGALLLYFATPGNDPATERSAGGESSPRVQTVVHRAVELPTKPIEEIQVGERVMGHNPDPTDADRDFPDPDPATWRKIQLRMSKESGKTLHITLLRPTTWIESTGAAVHKTIHLDMYEMDAVGPAEVLAITACPTIESGPGQVVTGTFSHAPEDNLVDVQIEGLPTPIGCTSNHQFWSENRASFVEAADLIVGEYVRTRAAGLCQVVLVKRRHKEAWVYNLEVNREHVYEVSDMGVTVHNTYAECLPFARQFTQTNGGIGVKLVNSLAPNGLYSNVGRLPGYGNKVQRFHAFVLKGGKIFDPAHPNGIDALEWMAQYMKLNKFASPTDMTRFVEFVVGI